MWKSADGNKDEAPEANEGAEAKGGDQHAKGGRGLLGKKLIILLVAGLALAGGGIGAAKFLAGGSDQDKPKEKEVVAPLTYEFADLVVNVRETADTRVLRCVIHVEVDNDKAVEELDLLDVVYRDEILEILRSKTLDDLKYPGENAVKRQIRDQLNRRMSKGSVVEVYFKEFLIH
jgi:flagellar basal body-associated protein FliL